MPVCQLCTDKQNFRTFLCYKEGWTTEACTWAKPLLLQARNQGRSRPPAPLLLSPCSSLASDVCVRCLKSHTPRVGGTGDPPRHAGPALSPHSLHAGNPAPPHPVLDFQLFLPMVGSPWWPPSTASLPECGTTPRVPSPGLWAARVSSFIRMMQRKGPLGLPCLHHKNHVASVWVS